MINQLLNPVLTQSTATTEEKVILTLEGTTIHSLNELREHFNRNEILSFYSDGTLPLPLHHAAVHNAPDVRWSIYIICKIRGVSTGGCKCLSKHLIPTLGRVRQDAFIEDQSSKAIRFFEIRK